MSDTASDKGQARKRKRRGKNKSPPTHADPEVVRYLMGILRGTPLVKMKNDRHQHEVANR